MRIRNENDGFDFDFNTNSKYDDRDWKHQYEKHCKNEGPHPGRHPDPNHVYNT